ncbi:MAG: sulfotransferase family 2 domain-containing protein [Anaerolineales bacterium]|nr:sulfotransferase family 2 domain-containing protein [Anaerolineales bacterium]
MNITRFVFVHIPKTGGTFVAQVLRDLYTPGWIRPIFWRKVYFRLTNTFLARTGLPAPHVELDKHAPCRAIPARYASLPIVSCMRNPFDWYVSNYRFQYWKRAPDHYPGLKDDPRWPNLSFDDFMHFSNHVWTRALNPGLEVNPHLGRLTTIFIQFFCREPERVLTEPGTPEQVFEKVKANMYPVQFLETSQLNDDLVALLLAYGYSERQIAFVRTLPPISPPGARKPEDRWERFYSPALMEEVRKRDAILFRLFPRY